MLEDEYEGDEDQALLRMQRRAEAAEARVGSCVTFESCLASQGVALILGESMSLGMHPRCKLLSFLRLRAVSRFAAIAMTARPCIARLDILAATHKNKDVREWATKVIESGWIHQCWPSKIVHRQGLLLRYNTGTGPRTGLPAGMRQHYFDEAQRQKRVLGWIAHDTSIQAEDSAAQGRRRVRYELSM